MNLSPAGTAVPPSASVVLCTYNGSAYIARQFESLLDQSRLPDQIVIADDASSDATVAAIESFAMRCRQAGIDVVLRLRQGNVGFIANFADALELASGDVIFLCDQDDVWHPDKLRTMVGQFAADPALTLLFTDARLVDGQGQPLEHTLFATLGLQGHEWHDIASGQAFPVLLRRAVVTGATTAFRRSLLHKALPVAPGWIHDEWLATVAALFGRIHALDHCWIDYRQHGANQIGARRRTLGMRIRDLFLPRNALLQTAVNRMNGLSQRFSDDPAAPAASLRLLEDRLAHYRQRIAMGERRRPARLPLALHEWRTGRYATHSNGFPSLLRDLLREH